MVYDLGIEIEFESVKVAQQIAYVHGVNIPVIPHTLGVTVSHVERKRVGHGVGNEIGAGLLYRKQFVEGVHR